MTFLRVMGFSLLLLGFYALFAHSLPQVEPDLSEPEVVSTEGLDMEGMIALGEGVFSGKGTCTLCHNGMGRAPDTLEMDLAVTFPERLNDPTYSGVAAGKEGSDAVGAYLRESMLEPSAFVVSGFGKKGTNDTESPMPVVVNAPIELSVVQVNAVIAFLQDRAGMTPTVPLPSAEDTPVEEAASAEGMVEAPVTNVQDALDNFACAACHDLNESGADLGPPLGGIADRMSRAELMGAILDPNAEIAEGYDEGLMPDTFAEDMHSSELLLIVDYLLTLRTPDPAEKPDGDDGPITDAIGVIDEYGCAGCHDLEDSEAELGPKLTGISARMDRDQLTAAIVDPNGEIAEGFEADMMPDYFGDDMTEAEMTLILDYLMNLPE